MVKELTAIQCILCEKVLSTCQYFGPLQDSAVYSWYNVKHKDGGGEQGGG